VGRITWRDVEAALASRPPFCVGGEVASRAAVAVVLREGPRGLEILFIRRAEHPEDPWSGHMAFPGGRAEPGETDLRLTAIRETAEEVGLDLAQDADYLGALDELQAMARFRPVDLAITPFVFRLRRPAPPRLSDEVRSLHWLPLDDLAGTRHQSTMDYTHQGAAFQFPCLKVEDLVIWGLTYRMFVGFRERLPSGVSPEGASGRAQG
jgi:8-oxo-dGTP pyrophosphatase MutT (NUDIX family)